MILAEHTVKTHAAPANIWLRYSDVSSWSEWDGEVESASIDGPFETGAKGRLQPKGAPRTTFRITAIEKERHFSVVSCLPLTRLILSHTITPTGDGSIFSHRVEMEGLLTFLFARVVGPKMRLSLPNAMEKLAYLAAETHHPVSV